MYTYPHILSITKIDNKDMGIMERLKRMTNIIEKSIKRTKGSYISIGDIYYHKKGKRKD